MARQRLDVSVKMEDVMQGVGYRSDLPVRQELQ